ncbi:MAG: porin family protein [Pseudolabrys sp.]|jgi:opacity protein-like surface antigen
MLGQRLKLAALTILTASVSAHAADYTRPYQPPHPVIIQQPPPVEDFAGGWYLRGDIGFSNQDLGSLGGDIYNGYDSVTSVDKSFDAAPFFGIGLGYTVNNWLRFDVTGEYRGRANFHGMDIGYVGSTIYPDNYSGSKSEWTFLANAYVDLGTWYDITPFVGGGVGVSRNTISSFTDVSNCSGGCGNPGTNTYFDTASKWSFAWALYAGLAYSVTPNVTIELAYRYLNLGDAETGSGHSYDGTYTYSPYEFNDLTSQDIKLGVRFSFGADTEPAPAYYQPPPPVYRPPPPPISSRG